MKLYAWIGEDELGSGEVGLKRALCPAGDVPLVAIDGKKLTRVETLVQLQAQADRYGKTIRFVEFELTVDGLIVITPNAPIHFDGWKK